MKTYFERFIICEICGESQRQTTQSLPLDRIGRALHRMFREEFKQQHLKCNDKVKYTSWRLGKIFKE
jgi:hypothetical protein